MYKILVIGSDHHNTLGVIESLGQKGLRPDVIIVKSGTDTYSFVLKSKYVDNGYTCHIEDLVQFVKDNYKSNVGGKTVVISTSDTVAATLDDCYDELSGFLVLPGTGQQGELRKWMGKDRMIELAKGVGLNVPKTAIVKKGETLNDFIFPCMTKSTSSLLGGKSNIRICHKKEELDEFLCNQKKYSDVQVQQFIDKDFEFQFIGYSLNGGNELIIPGRTHIDRPKGFDNTFYLKYVEIDDTFNDTLNKSKEFIKRTHYSGPFSIEFIRDKKGVDYFLEMNFRNDGNAICMTASGTNAPYIWYLYKTGGDYKTELSLSSFKLVNWMPEETYFFDMLRKEVTLGEWLKNLRQTTQFAIYFKEDKKPFRAYLRKEVKSYISRFFNNLFLRVWMPVFITPIKGSSLLEGKWQFHYLKNMPKNKGYADPFILDVTKDEIHLLVEEIRHEKPIGRIAKLIIDRNTYEIKNETVLLELETHLSFPAILRKDNCIYVYPENAASGELNIYKYEVAEGRFEKESRIINKPLSDAIIFEGFVRPCLIATRKPNSNGNVVEFYEADKSEGPYLYVSSVSFSDKIARGAGDVFEQEGRWIRPAQVNNKDYGEALCFQELKKTTEGYSLTELSRVKPPHGATCLHTFNSYNGIYVADVRYPVNPVLFYVARFFHRLVKR